MYVCVRVYGVVVLFVFFRGGGDVWSDVYMVSVVVSSVV